MSDNCIWIDDCEPPSVSRSVLRRARKPHVCCECGEAICAGDLYENVDGCWGGEWGNFKTCARCVNVRTDYFVGWTFTMMVEDFKSAHGFDYREGIPANFTPCGRAAPTEETKL